MHPWIQRAQWLSLYALNALVCFLAGKDYNWDLLNYHFYGPDLLLRARWTQDYFAASIQSYLNPIAYVPFYLMVRWDWPAILIGLVLSTIHFLNILIIGSIAHKILERYEAQRAQLVALSCLLAISAPLYLQANGSTFNDPIGSIFVLLALRILLSSNAERSRQLFLVGLCTGVAIGIKLTSGIFGLAFILVIAADLLSGQRSTAAHMARLTLAYSLGGALGFAIVHGYWSALLIQHFGSPVFPFFNGVFRSEEFGLTNIRDLRFLGSGVLGLLRLPFDMLQVQSWIYIEAPSPDIRPLALIFSTAFFICVYIWRKLPSHGAMRSAASGAIYSATRSSSRAIWIVCAFSMFSFVIWGITSRIGRYAFPLWLLLGPILALATAALAIPKLARVFLTLVLCAQIYLNLHHGTDRLAPVTWGTTWFDFQLPQEIIRNPAGIISTDTMSFSAIVPSIHEHSSMATIMGMHTMPNGRDTPKQLQHMIDNYKGNLYIMYAVGQYGKGKEAEISKNRLGILNDKIGPYGLAISSDQCSFGDLAFNRKSSNFSTVPYVAEGFRLAFCKLKSLSESEKLASARLSKQHDDLFNAIEDQCPGTFSPKRVVTIHHSNEFVRSYFNTATGLYTDHGAVYMTGYRVLFPTFITTLKNPTLSSLVCPPLPAQRYLK
ncbi:hypothetical protein ACSFA0_02065 [Variovorax sp. LT1P1]|uniref:hypothetical protein n=1 Tax=Variovorax sp. LT1P1 TaxID=3443730 RepID=UPI003F44E806